MSGWGGVGGRGFTLRVEYSIAKYRFVSTYIIMLCIAKSLCSYAIFAIFQYIHVCMHVCMHVCVHGVCMHVYRVSCVFSNFVLPSCIQVLFSLSFSTICLLCSI